MSADLMWKELEHRFRELQAEMTADGLMAWYARFCWDDGLTEEQWVYRGGGDRNQKRFESLATAGARKLGFTDNANADNGWLARVREYLGAKITVTGTQIVDGRTATTEGESIERIAGASADYCLQLIARGTPEATVGLQSQASDTPIAVFARSADAWKIMQHDVTLRHSRMVGGWNEQLQKDKLELDFEDEKRKNAGYYLPTRVALEIRHTDERAQRLYEACCEVGEIHAIKRNRVFFRAIFEHCLTPLFAGRCASVTGELQLRDTRIGRPGQCAPALGSLRQQMDHLRADWNTKLEIQTCNDETRERVMLARKAQPVSALPRLDLPSSHQPEVPPKPEGISHKRIPPPSRRLRTIFGVLQSKVTGLKYCVALDNRGLTTPEDWQLDGCPKAYKDAYQDPKWRQRLHNEKSKYATKFRAVSEVERDQIIEASVRTGSTSQRPAKVRTESPRKSR